MRRNEVKKSLITGGVLLLGALMLSACSSVKQEMGVGRHSPNAFDVVTRAPLTLPPDYALRPPESAGAAAVGSTANTSAQVKNELMGENMSSGNASAAQKQADPAAMAFMDKLGVEHANPDIRQMIDQDNGYIALKNQPVADKLIFWQDTTPSAKDIPEAVINPEAEAERIKKVEAEGKPINADMTPTIRQKTNTLDKLF